MTTALTKPGSARQRGFWAHGVENLRDYMASAELFTMHGRAELIQCPTLITQAENDPVTAGAFFYVLRYPKTLLRFTADEGAGGHCEMRTGRSSTGASWTGWMSSSDATHDLLARCTERGVADTEPLAEDAARRALATPMSRPMTCPPTRPSSLFPMET
jgi:hypothetical protein